MLALPQRRRAEGDGPVVPQDHGLPGRAPRRHGGAALVAGSRLDAAAELGGTIPRRRSRLRRRGGRPYPGLHDPDRHDLRSDLHGPRPGTPTRGRTDGRRHGRSARRRIEAPWPGPPSPARGEGGEGGSLHGTPRREPLQRGADSDLGGELRPDGLWHGRHHGRPGSRPARLRVRPKVRHRGAGGDPAGGLEPRGRSPGDGVRRAGPSREQRRMDGPGFGDGHRRHDCSRRGEGLREENDQLSSQGLAHQPTALLGDADSGGVLRAGRCRRCAGRRSSGRPPEGRALHRRGRQSPREGARFRDRDVPALRRPGASRNGYHGHLRRFVVVLLPLPLPAKDGRAVRCRCRSVLVSHRSLRGWDRARHPAPRLLALLDQDDARPRARDLRRAGRTPLPAGDGPQGGRGDVQEPGQHRRSRHHHHALWGRYAAPVHPVRRAPRDAPRMAGRADRRAERLPEARLAPPGPPRRTVRGRDPPRRSRRS